MAIYNNGFPMNYQYYYQQPFAQAPMQAPMQASGQVAGQVAGNYQQAQSNPQIQSGGFIPVASEMDARNYPVAPGNSVTFKDEKLPYVYVKTMGFSSLDRPVFEKFRLVKESEPQNENTGTPEPQANKSSWKLSESEFKAVTDEIEHLKQDVEAYKLNMENLESDTEDLRKKVAGFFSKPERRSNERKPHTND